MINEFKGDYFFLSNFYHCHIWFDGYLYHSSEQLYQAHKAVDTSGLMSVQACTSPGDAKRQGKQIKVRPDWDAVKKTYMYSTLLCKFTQNPLLADGLIETYPHSIVEGNDWHDNYWGSCTCDQCTESINVLGTLLMEVRNVLSFIGGEK